jgi:hypothetical protein
MSKPKRVRRNSSRPPSTPRRPFGDIQLVTPKGDEIVFASARYLHDSLDEIRTALKQARDFHVGPVPEPDGSYSIDWQEGRSRARRTPAPIGKRVLAHLTLTQQAIEIEAMSEQRLADCRKGLEYLLGDHIRLTETKIKSTDQALREHTPRGEPPAPFIPPPEVIAEIEEKLLRQWIDDSIPALDGLTPREAVKTPEGRKRVLELIDYVGQLQKTSQQTPGAFAPDYRKVKKMLGLE